MCIISDLNIRRIHNTLTMFIEKKINSDPTFSEPLPLPFDFSSSAEIVNFFNERLKFIEKIILE